MNMNEILKQAKRMQAEMETKEKEIANKEFIIEKLGITLKITGDRKLKSVKIDEALVDPEDPETLEDLIVVAFNEAMSQIDEAYEEISDSMPKGTMPF